MRETVNGGISLGRTQGAPKGPHPLHLRPRVSGGGRCAAVFVAGMWREWTREELIAGVRLGSGGGSCGGRGGEKGRGRERKTDT